MSPERNLLFGILALQNDFVTRDQLVEAMNSWVLARHRPLGELLRERGALGEEEHTLLEALVNLQLAKATCTPMRSTSLTSSGPPRCSSPSRVQPSTYSITR